MIERRGEDIDRGFDRLANAATDLGATLEGVLSRLLTTVAEDTAGDDIAILAFRWIDAIRPTRSLFPPADCEYDGVVGSVGNDQCADQSLDELASDSL